MEIIILDGREVPNPEDLAMLQALYTRSSLSVREHLKRVEKTGSKRFMDNYVVGFGHKSIADGGSTTVFIEGVSLLAAKAIQDWPLYSGQETSTRYIDMAKQPIVDPLGTSESKAILDRWMDFYTSNQEPVQAWIRTQHPQQAEDDPKAYEGAVKARTFDIMRAFLPAGITTNLSWHTNFRQAGDHLALLTKHPAEEIRNLGKKLEREFQERYPSSGAGAQLATVSSVTGNLEARQAWEHRIAAEYTYLSTLSSPMAFSGDWFMFANLDRSDIHENGPILESRPKGCVLPHVFDSIGSVGFKICLDFGSFRDLQRHRKCVCRMPLLKTFLGFEEWYLDQLPSDVRNQAEELIAVQTKAIQEITNPVEAQYYTALGFKIQTEVTYPLSGALYMMELRSGKTVHPTLRNLVRKMVGAFKAEFPRIALHADMDPNDWTVRRGTQTITEKSTA